MANRTAGGRLVEVSGITVSLPLFLKTRRLNTARFFIGENSPPETIQALSVRRQANDIQKKELELWLRLNDPTR